MSEATEPEITTGAWILGQQAKLRAAEADANQLRGERDEATECYGKALKDLEKVLDQRDELLRWGNAAMVRFEAMLLTKEDFIDAAAERHRELEADANRLSKALEGITDPDPCTVFDHHGYCQTHGWLSETLCGHAAARIALRQHKEPDAGD
ncbi:hypothetical protein LCGC14_0587580 [marine sediment metagenome]|uniref:Uncharacterized protein n=1 Tax=marine sediment metagenome TaxID=412755 RepID=A0A0F9REE3_9ZZZZ